MKKSIIWELIKINILYSNPQLLASVKKKQNKKKNASFSAYKSILRQQIFMMIIFAFIYTVFFLGVDYSESVGFFSLQLSIFTIMSIATAFTGRIHRKSLVCTRHGSTFPNALSFSFIDYLLANRRSSCTHCRFTIIYPIVAVHKHYQLGPFTFYRSSIA